MTRKSKQELEQALDALEAASGEPPEEPPHDWMQYVPPELWTDRVAALRYFSKQADEAENGA